MVFMSRTVIAVLIWAVLTLWGSPLVAQTVEPTELAAAVESMEYLDALRHSLAATLDPQTEEPITGETFKAVCQPVDLQAKQLSSEKGWLVKQMAFKYRNTDHAPDNLHSRIALARFQQNPDLFGFWDRETLAGVEGTRYYRRINTEASCLACHGQQASRPSFVVQKYPDDRAYDFAVGDLRGTYAVFIPDHP